MIQQFTYTHALNVRLIMRYTELNVLYIITIRRVTLEHYGFAMALFAK